VPTEATLFWDYDNVNPRFLNVSVPTFFAYLRQFLRATHGINVRDSAVYLVAGKEYGNVPEKLSALQMRMRLCSAKREAADRELSGDMRTLKDQAALLRQSISVVLVSSDKDFIRDVKDMTDAGHSVFVIHNAVAGSDHEMMLGMYATASISVNAFLVAIGTPGGADGAATAEEESIKLPPTIRIGDDNIKTDDLLINDALIRFCNGEDDRPPQFCTRLREANHDPLTCNRLHKYPETFRIGDCDIPRAHLVNNKLLSWLMNHPDAVGRWCINVSPAHDHTSCQFAHRKPGFANVNGMTYPIAALIDNPARKHLEDNPTHSGKACTMPTPHDPATCRYAHFVSDSADVSKRATATVASIAPPPPPYVPAPAGRHGTTVRIANEDVDVALLVPNSQVSYLLAHPHLSGTLCRFANDPGHDAVACKYLHYRRTAEQSGPWVRVTPNSAQPQPQPQPHVVRPLQPPNVFAQSVHRGPTVDSTTAGAQPPNIFTSSNPGSNLATPTRTTPLASPSYGVAAAVTGYEPLSYASAAARIKPSLVSVAGVDIPVDSLAENVGLRELLRRYPTGEGHWCRQAGTLGHDVAACGFIHHAQASRVNPAPAVAPPVPVDSAATVLVDLKRIPVNELVHGSAVKYLLANPAKNGQWCRFHEECPNVMGCSYVHPLTHLSEPVELRVEEHSIPIDELIANKAVEYLRANPTRTGKWCRNTRPHDAKECPYFHRK
jgi:hypothetical protein